MSTQDTQEQGQEQGNVGGGWLGTYTYKGGRRTQPPVRFEATFTAPDGEGKFQGTILDDHGLGEANVAGGQSGRGIRFSKRYRRRGQVSVSYEGTLADDGRTMGGTWRIADIAHGVWDARRLWSEVASDTAVEEVEERKVARVREVVRLG
jgi:hypothetical protein